MATYNPNLENLNLEQILAVSERFLMGWNDLIADGHGFRVKGLNRRRAENGLEPLTKDMSVAYRIQYIREHYTRQEILDMISDYLVQGRVAEERWPGIYLFDCRFGPEYVTIFRELLGSSVYRELSEKARVAKLSETQVDRYGGVGLAGDATKQKAHATVQTRYGVDNVMQADEVKSKVTSPFADSDVRAKAELTKWTNIQEKLNGLTLSDGVPGRILKSRYETLVFCELIQRFGRDDVYYEYGIHPSDARYPHNCDFYIKSLDLFIELHCHYSHGNHWYDASNHDDQLRRQHLLASTSHRSVSSVKTWCDIDLKKREDARRSGIRYLVFWDGTTSSKKAGNVPNLSDFYVWFRDYDCDYDKFIADFPGNTY